MDVVVARFNELGGLSNTFVDKAFLKRLPITTRLGIRLVIIAARWWVKWRARGD
ncbi:putative glycosyl transferase [Mycobacterium kansasii 824]|nr:putative glycosyl transferase [Mycobacterium kansasii 824]